MDVASLSRRSTAPFSPTRKQKCRCINELIGLTASVGGEPRVAGHRNTVQDIAVWHERTEWSVDEIASEYDLSLAAVHAARAYYFAHRERIDRSIEESRAFVEEMKE